VAAFAEEFSVEARVAGFPCALECFPINLHLLHIIMQFRRTLGRFRTFTVKVLPLFKIALLQQGHMDYRALAAREVLPGMGNED
jgi:hypothetical protein